MLKASVTHAEPPWLAPSASCLPEAKGLPTRVATLTACSSRVRRWEVPARDVEASDDREPEPEATRPCPRPEDRRVLHRRPAPASRRPEDHDGGGGAAAAAPRPR